MNLIELLSLGHDVGIIKLSALVEKDVKLVQESKNPNKSADHGLLSANLVAQTVSIPKTCQQLPRCQ